MVKQAFKLGKLETQLPFLFLYWACKGTPKGPVPKTWLYIRARQLLKKRHFQNCWGETDWIEMCPRSWEERKRVSSASPAFQSSSFYCLPCTNLGTVSAKGPHALSQPVGSCSPFPHSLSGLCFIPFAFYCLENSWTCSQLLLGRSSRHPCSWGFFQPRNCRVS